MATANKGGEVPLAGAKFLKYAMVEDDVVPLGSVHRRVAEVVHGDAMYR
jgi:hypothetical protein